MGTGDILLEGNPGLASRPGGSSNTPRHASCYRNRYKLRPFGPLARVRLYLSYVLSSTEILTAFIPRGVFSGGAWNILTNVGRNLSIKSWKETLTSANHSLVEVAWEQTLLFGQAKRASRAPRGFAARSRVLARLVSLAQIGELAHRLWLKWRSRKALEATKRLNFILFLSSRWKNAYKSVAVKGERVTSIQR